MEDLGLDCPDHPVEYNYVDDTQQVELTIDMVLLELNPSYGTRAQTPGEHLPFVREEEWENANNGANEGDAEDDNYGSAEDVELSASPSRRWIMERCMSHYRGEDDRGSSDGLTSDDDRASTPAPRSSSSSTLSDSYAFEVLTVYSDSGNSWKTERASSETAEEVGSDGERMGCAEPRDAHEGSDLRVAPSPGESAPSDAETVGGSDEGCTTAARHFQLKAETAQQVPDVGPAWKLAPRALINKAVGPLVGSCAAYCNPRLLEASILAQRKDILRDQARKDNPPNFPSSSGRPSG